MNDLIKQLGSVLGAVFAAACCLGLPVLLSALSAAGLGFLIHDAILIPLLIVFVTLNLWLLRRSCLR
ncbi:MAG: MerC domain-containing protein, partial [Gammaproteobacteria bacterium]|nr:MerC domain-containing protein [Gammaproteobacteria bacterium]